MGRQRALHDKFFCAMLSDPKVAKDFLRMYLPKNIFAQTDLDSLEILPRKYINENLKCLEADVVLRLKFKNRNDYLYVLIEHQSEPHFQMLLRADKYRHMIHESHCYLFKTEVLPVVYGIVYYNGAKQYPYAKSVKNITPDIPHIKEYMYHWVKVADLNDLELEEQKHCHWAELVNRVMSYPIHKSEDLFFKQLTESLHLLENFDKNDRIFAMIMSYYLSVSGETDLQHVSNKADRYLPPKLRERTMALADHLRAQGLEEGLQQGMQQGMQQGKVIGSQQATLQIAKKLITQSTDLSIIAKATGLSMKQLQSLKDQEMN